ncbi:MAG: hypothetical protein HRU19_28110 [Pseudobacteriovorax sp.]|nr:hypothetical protein [Pseudobacteriovorax sp.]
MESLLNQNLEAILLVSGAIVSCISIGLLISRGFEKDYRKRKIFSTLKLTEFSILTILLSLGSQWFLLPLLTIGIGLWTLMKRDSYKLATISFSGNTLSLLAIMSL